MLTAELLLRWKGAVQVVLPVLLALDMVHSICYVAGLYQDRLEVRAEVLFLACKSAIILHLETKHDMYYDRTGKKRILLRQAQKCFLSCKVCCTIARTKISFCGQKQLLQPLRKLVVADPPWLMLSHQASNQTVTLAPAQLQMCQLKKRWILPHFMMFSSSLDLLPRK